MRQTTQCPAPCDDGDRATALTDRRLGRALTALTILGFLVPNAMVVASLTVGGLEVGGYFGAWITSIPSAQLLVDLGLCTAAFLAWAAHDARRLQIRWWPIIPATFLVGLCFAIPLYLRSRELSVVRRPDWAASNRLRDGGDRS